MKLVWDKEGERYYETGVEKGVVYPYNSESSGVGNSTSKYDKGAAWNGLTAVTESPSGAEASAVYADNIKYLNLISREEFGATVEAYTYPDEFAACDGSMEPIKGLKIHQQPRKPFGLSYQTKIGNDIDYEEHGYKIHLVYNALAAPSEKSHSTINESPEAETLSWELSTTPVKVDPITVDGNTYKFRDSAHIEIDNRDYLDTNGEYTNGFLELEKALYGIDAFNGGATGEPSIAGLDPWLPLPNDVFAILNGTMNCRGNTIESSASNGTVNTDSYENVDETGY